MMYRYVSWMFGSGLEEMLLRQQFLSNAPLPISNRIEQETGTEFFHKFTHEAIAKHYEAHVHGQAYDHV